MAGRKLMLVKPSTKTFKSLFLMSKTVDSYDGGDQGLLNQYFKSWYNSDAEHRLPFGFKCVQTRFSSIINFDCLLIAYVPTTSHGQRTYFTAPIASAIMETRLDLSKGSIILCVLRFLSMQRCV